MSTRYEQTIAAELAILADRIRRVQVSCGYDYRKDIPQSIKDSYPHIHSGTHGAHHVLYGENKYAVAAVLLPRTVYEVGIGWGISARAFMAASGCEYFGVDSAEMGVDIATALSGTPGHWLQADSDDLDVFAHPAGKIDLIHIDGSHEIQHKERDVMKAINSGAEWLLVDDCHNQAVVAGTFWAFYKHWNWGSIPYIFMENSHSGGILFQIGARGVVTGQQDVD